MKLFLKKGLLISLLLQGCISYEVTSNKSISSDLQKDLVPQDHYVHGTGLLVTLWNSQIFYRFNLTNEEKLLHQQTIIYSLNLDTNDSKVVSWSNFDQSAYGVLYVYQILIEDHRVRRAKGLNPGSFLG